MLLTIQNSRGDPYNLNPDITARRLAALKAYITRCKGNSEAGKLQHLKQQLDDVAEKNEQESLISDLVDAALAEINAQVELKVVSDDLNLDVDINTKAGRTRLKVVIRNLCKRKTLNAAQKLARLTPLIEQINAHKAANEGFTDADDVLRLLQQKVHAYEQERDYQTYPTFLAPDFLSVRDDRRPTVRLETESRNAQITKYDADALRGYLVKPVAAKRKLADHNREELLHCFWFDFARTAGFLGHDLTTRRLLLYATLLAYFFAHNSSYYSAQGYGQTVASDKEKQLFYFRSQEAHPHVAAAVRAGRLQEDAEANGDHNYGRINDSFKTMLLSIMPASQRRDQLEALGADGRFAYEGGSDYFGAFLGYIGGRANNITMHHAGLEYSFERIANVRDALSEILPRSRTVRTIERDELSASLRSVVTATRGLREGLGFWHRDEDLSSSIAAERNVTANSIVTQAVGLQKIAVIHPDNCSFVVLNLYPEFKSSLRESDNFRQGLTNILIGFLTGLINYNAQQRGLHAFLQRRQSFGFLRATITNVGSLRIRLSLGLEPSVYSEVIVESIRQLDVILRSYDFEHYRRGDAHELVKEVSRPYEAARGKKATERTGNYLLKAVHNSEKDQWAAGLVSQKCISQAANAGEGGAADVDPHVSQGFEAYLRQFVLRRVHHEDVSAERDSAQISLDGFSMNAAGDIPLVEPLEEENPEGVLERNVVFKTLYNIIYYAISYISDLDAEALDINYSNYFLLLKLLHNCQKGLAILNNLRRYDITHLAAKSNLIVENVLEYMTLFRYMVNNREIDLECHDDLEEGDLGQVGVLHAHELYKLKQILAVAEEDEVDLFFNDSGQQATATMLIAMYKQHSLDRVGSEAGIYLFPNSYYEVAKFCSETKIYTVKDLADSTVWMVDVADLRELNRIIFTEDFAMPKLHSVVIDITNNSSPEFLRYMAGTVKRLRALGMFVLLTVSDLKHGELGLDKCQTGRSFVLPPNGRSLDVGIRQEVAAVSREALHPLVAGFRNMIEGVSYPSPVLVAG